MTAIPPSRYKVVERDRRLVVIDTHSGQPAVREPRPVAVPMRSDNISIQPHAIESAAPRRVDDRSGARILTTSRFYDLKAPREIVMGDRFDDRIGRVIGGWLVGLFFTGSIALLFFPWLLVVPIFLLLQPKFRAGIRGWITARLDDVQAG